MKALSRVAGAVCRILGVAYARQKEFPNYYRDRREVKNWKYLYIVRSSLLLYLINKTYHKLKGEYLFNTFKVTPRDPNQLVYWVPYDYVSPRLAISFEAYSRDFRNYFHHDIDFNCGDTILDIGSHIGTFGIPLKREYPGVRVISFEPNRHNFELQLRNIRHNQVEDQFVVENAAVSDANGQEIFSVDSSLRIPQLRDPLTNHDSFS